MGRVKEIHTREERYARKNARRGEMRKEARKAAFITDYLLLRSPEIHREATEFFDQLERIYPTKLDLRKTVQFKNWQRKRLGIPTQGRGNCLDVATPEDHRITVPEDQNTAMPEDHEPRNRARNPPRHAGPQGNAPSDRTDAATETEPSKG